MITIEELSTLAQTIAADHKEIAKRREILSTYYKNYHFVFIPELKTFIKDRKKLALNLNLLISKTDEKLQNYLRIYIENILKLDTLIFTTNHDVNALSECDNQLEEASFALEALITQLSSPTGKMNDPVLLKETETLLHEISVAQQYTSRFIESPKQIANMQTILSKDEFNLSNLEKEFKDKQHAFHLQTESLASSTQKKSPQNSSSATPSSTPPSTLQLWLKQCLNTIEKDLTDFIKNQRCKNN